MKIERFEIPGLAQYSYIISSDGDAAVIDPIRDVDRYTAYASEHKLTITHVLETHIHADFAAGSVALAKDTGAKLALSGHDEGERYRYSMPHCTLYDGQSIQIGAVRLQALHTPGHTPEHLSFVLYDRQRNAAVPVVLFSGDFLFVGSLGRPDLLGDDAKQGLARELYRSLHERIASLPDHIEIYPGHGAGSLCGAGMSERPESTLGYERATNPVFKLTEDEFMREILIDVPEMPSYYPRIKELNAKGAPSLTCLPGQPLSVEAVKSLSAQQDVTLLDLRRPEAFGGAHIMGAFNIGAGQNLALWAGWLLSSAQRIVLISHEGDDQASRRALIRVGLDHIEGFLIEGMPAWIEAGEEFTRTPQLSTAEVKNRLAKSVVVDVRSDKEWEGGHIEGAQHIMLGDLQKNLDGLPRDRPLITVCGSGYRSSIAASLLARAGFASISSMDGGMTAWHRQKLPMTTN